MAETQPSTCFSTEVPVVRPWSGAAKAAWGLLAAPPLATEATGVTRLRSAETVVMVGFPDQAATPPHSVAREETVGRAAHKSALVVSVVTLRRPAEHRAPVARAISGPNRQKASRTRYMVSPVIPESKTSTVKVSGPIVALIDKGGAQQYLKEKRGAVLLTPSSRPRLRSD